MVVKPETLLSWHRSLFRIVWRRKSRPKGRKPRISQETIKLIKKMARDNRLWGSERIRGELLKLGIKVSKRTIQKHMRSVRPRRGGGQDWSTFLHNHMDQTWACDFLQTHDLLFRPVFVFVIIELHTRRVLHVSVTRSPSDQWTAQQLRNTLLDHDAPRFLIRDNDNKFGARFKIVADSKEIEMLRTPIRAPKANAHCERFLGSLRRECLDHILILSEEHLRRTVAEYVRYHNESRPHQGLGQVIPWRLARGESRPERARKWPRPSLAASTTITATPRRNGPICRELPSPSGQICPASASAPISIPPDVQQPL